MLVRMDCLQYQLFVRQWFLMEEYKMEGGPGRHIYGSTIGLSEASHKAGVEHLM